MNKVLTGCFVVWMGTALSGFSGDAASVDSASMAQVLQRLDKIEKRLDELEGKHLPGAVSLSTLHNDVKKLQSDVRSAVKKADRAASDVRRLESRR